MDIAATLLPEPLSPTRPSVLPLATEKEMPSTTLTSAPSEMKWVVRFRTSSMFADELKRFRPHGTPREPCGRHQRSHRCSRRPQPPSGCAVADFPRYSRQTP